MPDTTAVPTYAVTHQIDYYGGASRLRVLTLTDDLAEALAEKQALNDAACAPYGAWQVGHNEASNFHTVYELVQHIDYNDWDTLPNDLFDAACAILETPGMDPDSLEDIDTAVDEAAAELGYKTASDDTDGWGAEWLLLRELSSDSPTSQAAA